MNKTRIRIRGLKHPVWLQFRRWLPSLVTNRASFFNGRVCVGYAFAKRWTATRGSRTAWRELHDTFPGYGGPPFPLAHKLRNNIAFTKKTWLSKRQDFRVTCAKAVMRVMK